MVPQIDGKVSVSKERYLEIIGFTSYAYMTEKITKYSGMAGGRTRTLGEYIENFIYGKIAEEAFKLFLETQLGLEVLTEVDIADFYYGVYLPDIVAVKKGNEFVPLKFWVDVKEVRRDQKWLLVPASSIRQRPYDAYVAVWVGLPDEHVIWLVKNVPEAKGRMSKEWIEKIEEVESEVDNIPCQVLGFVLWDDITNLIKMNDGNQEARQAIAEKFGEGGAFYFDGETPLFDPEDTSWKGSVVKENAGFFLKYLGKNSNWEEFASLIKANKKTVPPVPFPRTKKGKLSKKSELPSEFSDFDDYREAFQVYFERQLGEIKKRFGGIQRTTSWFSQPLE